MGGGGGGGVLTGLLPVSAGSTYNISVGGGGAAVGSSPNSGAGGSGIVIVSYPDIYPALTTGGATSPTISTSGSGSMLFNGSTQTLQFADSSAFALGSGDFTIECWLYRTTTGQMFFAGQIDSSGNASNGSFVFYINSSNYLSLSAYQSSSGIAVTDSVAIANNQWNHVAVVRDTNTLRLYKNGVQAATASITGAVNDSAYRLGIGNAGEYLTQPFAGYITNFRLVKGTCLYPSGTTFTPSTTPLTAVTNTSLLVGAVSGAYLQDSSSNGFSPATNTVAPAWNQLSPFATGLGYKNRVYTWVNGGGAGTSATGTFTV
jgi:hypothetical protein